MLDKSSTVEWLKLHTPITEKKEYHQIAGQGLVWEPVTIPKNEKSARMPLHIDTESIEEKKTVDLADWCGAYEEGGSLQDIRQY